ADIEAHRDCCAIIDELAPTADEVQLTKRGYGAFLGTALDSILRDRNIDGVIRAGSGKLHSQDKWNFCLTSA
ncbi:isochorismatase family protein, partial [Rhizobium leguminosarum]